LDGLPAQARLLIEDGLLTSSGRRDSMAWEDALAEFGMDEQDVLTLIDRHLLRREDHSDGARIELVHDRLADIVRKHRDCRREEERTARELAELHAREAELEREKEIHRRKFRRLLVACVALALFGLVVSSYLAWDGYLHRWRHEAYFSNYTTKNGIFEGIGPLTAEQVNRRRSSLKFIRRGACGPLIRVQAVDGKRRLTHRSVVDNYMRFAASDENPAGECQWEFVQDETGRIAYELAYDRNANLVWGLAYSPWLGADHQRVAHFVGPDGLPSSQMKTAAEYVRIEYLANGLEKQISYYDRSGKPQLGRDGAYAIRMEYDSRGMLNRWMALDDHRLPMIAADGFAESRFKYDERGNGVEWACFNTSGKPCLNNDGYAKTTAQYDERGNQVEWACFGLGDEPTIDQSVGNHMVKYTYDESGNCTASELLGVDGKPCLIKNGYAKETVKYDERGNQVEWACFGLSDEPRINQSFGNHMFKYTYDERGYLVVQEYRGIDGKPCLVRNGYAKVTAKYDERGHEIEEAWFDESGNPIASNGVARWDANFDEKGNATAVWYFDREGKLTNGQLFVTEVLLGGQAAAAGLLVGDMLISYDGKAIIHMPELFAWVRIPGGALRELVISRRGRCMSFNLKPGVMGVRVAARAVAVPAF
jgi:hypothetical protein